MNTKFNSASDLIDFLIDTLEWVDWEVIKLQMASSSGVSLVLNTKINDPSGKREFQSLRKLKIIIQSFMIENQGVNVSIDIKLRLPREFKIRFDDNNEYTDFFIDFFLAGQLIMVSTSQVERSLSSSVVPINNWESFVQLKADRWKAQHNYDVT